MNAPARPPPGRPKAGSAFHAAGPQETTPLRPVRVWDLPLRLFHWLLVACLVGSFVTVKAGVMDWHFRFGYTALTLIVFRILWGFVGPRYARFGSFLFGPSALLAYLRKAAHAPRTLGHTPVGALSVFALIAVVGIQASAGLFTSDDIASEGPLARLVSNATVETAGWLHHVNEPVIVALVALHLGAILFYRFFKRQSLVKPMVVGDKLVPIASADVQPARDDAPIRLRALVVAAVAVAIVACIVNWPVF